MRGFSKLIAGVTALTLLSGCGWLRPGASDLERQLGAMAELADAQLLTGLIITPDPDQTAAQFRLVGEDAWHGWTRFATWPDEPQLPRGGVLVADLPYQGLDAQLAELAERCDDNPRVVAFVSPAGAFFAESRCGSEAASQVLDTWLDGEPFGTPQLEFSGVEDYDLLYREITAALPNPEVYQIGIPGQAAGPDRLVTVQGLAWLLADRQNCLVRYTRNLDPQLGQPLREYDCEGLGAQQGPTDRQDALTLAEFTAEQLDQQINQALAASGFAPERVENFLIMNLFYGGPTVAVQTADGEQYMHNF